MSLIQGRPLENANPEIKVKKDDIDVDEVNVDGNFKIWFPDNIGLPKYY